MVKTKNGGKFNFMSLLYPEYIGACENGQCNCQKLVRNQKRNCILAVIEEIIFKIARIQKLSTWFDVQTDIEKGVDDTRKVQRKGGEGTEQSEAKLFQVLTPYPK